jgi:hypothetical protein
VPSEADVALVRDAFEMGGLGALAGLADAAERGRIASMRAYIDPDEARGAGRTSVPA